MKDISRVYELSNYMLNMALTASTILKTEFGDFKVSYHEFGKQYCVSFSKGDLLKNEPIVRIHSACLFGEAFHSLHCDCSHQITKTMGLIKNNKNGVIVYSYQEGRGIGLKNKIKAMEIERIENVDTVEAFKKLGFEKSDYREYKIEIQALKELGLSKKIKTFSGSPKKIEALEKAGYKVEQIIPEEPLNLSEIAKKERMVKVKKLGYKY